MEWAWSIENSVTFRPIVLHVCNTLLEVLYISTRTNLHGLALTCTLKTKQTKKKYKIGYTPVSLFFFSFTGWNTMCNGRLIWNKLYFN